jgi:D-serine deaminase-like pyridoxal phosphate-dependent protein
MTSDLLARHGIACPTVTGAGTGTFEFESASGVYTELQCGSYIFMDADYGRNLDRDGAPTKAFEPSLFVWATVMSRPTEDCAIVDAGLKALAFDSGPPLVCDEPAATYERASDEHCRLAVGVPQSRRFILTASRYAVRCIGDSIIRRQADRGAVRRSGCSRLSRDRPSCQTQARSGRCGEQNE